MLSTLSVKHSIWRKVFLMPPNLDPRDNDPSALVASVTVYVTLRRFGPTFYVRIFDRRSVTYGALRRQRSWRGAWAANLWCARAKRISMRIKRS